MNKYRHIGVVGTHINEGLIGAWVHCLTVALVERLIANDPYTVVVSGGAKGTNSVDAIAEMTVRRLIREYTTMSIIVPEPIIHYPEVHPPGHPRAGKWVHGGAGLERNSKIVNDSTDGVYAIWNGISRGAEDSIKKALVCSRLLAVFFTNGMVWKQGMEWSPIEYGGKMADQFDPELLARVLLLRIKANKRSKLCLLPNGAPNEERLAYAHRQTIHAFNRLAAGDRPEAGIGDQKGHWFVPSENKKKEGVRPHDIGPDEWCNCDAVTRGRKWDTTHGNPCHAQFMVWMYKHLIAPEGLPHEADNT